MGLYKLFTKSGPVSVVLPVSSVLLEFRIEPDQDLGTWWLY
jgi:hypothetical protein